LPLSLHHKILKRNPHPKTDWALYGERFPEPIQTVKFCFKKMPPNQNGNGNAANQF